MHMPKRPGVVASLVLGLGLAASWAQTSPPAKPSSPEAKPSLIRMDLLRLPQEEMIPPLRNIFAPGTRTSRPVESAFQESQPWPQDEQAAETPVSAASEGSTTPPVLTVNLRYIGFIESARRMIALVLFEGQAVAVVEGEVVGEGIRIGRITRDEVEVILPDSSTRLFSFEGE